MTTSNSKRILIPTGIAVLLAALFLFLRYAGAGGTFAGHISRGGTFFLPLVLASSLIDSMNPCAFSVLLLTIAFLFSIGKMRKDILQIGGAYIAGIFAAWLFIGLGLFHALRVFDTPHFMAKAGAVLAMALGVLGLASYFFPKFPIRLGIPQSVHGRMAALMERASFPAAFVLGLLVGLCEFPCTGGPYIMILGLLHDKATYLSGLGYLLLYNVVFVLPLIAALFIAADESLIGKVQSWKKQEGSSMHFWGGLGMIALGVIIFLL